MAEPLEAGMHLVLIEDDYRNEPVRVREAAGSPSLLEEFRHEDMRVRLVCTGTVECTEAEHPDIDDVEDPGEIQPLHDGIEHRHLDGCWMTRTDSCIVRTDGYESGTVMDLPWEVGFIPGAQYAPAPRPGVPA